MSSRKGDRNERRIRNAVDDQDDWKTVRMPASGGGTGEDLPDLHLWFRQSDDHVRQYAAEVKAFAAGNSARLPNEEVEALCRYARDTGATPIVIAHPDYGADYVMPIADLHSTPKGYTVTKKRDIECDDPPLTLGDFLGNPSVVD